MEMEEEYLFDDKTMKDKLRKGTGPKRFRYKELAITTSNFTESGKLRERGFRSVYSGFVKDLEPWCGNKKSVGIKPDLPEVYMSD